MSENDFAYKTNCVLHVSAKRKFAKLIKSDIFHNWFKETTNIRLIERHFRIDEKADNILMYSITTFKQSILEAINR